MAMSHGSLSLVPGTSATTGEFPLFEAGHEVDGRVAGVPVPNSLVSLVALSLLG